MYRKVLVTGACILVAILFVSSHRSNISDVPQADQIVISKSAHSLELRRNGQILRTYKVSLGKGGSAPKTHEGDHLTPEGKYTVDGRNSNSRFYKALHLSYPNESDRARAAASHLPAGGDIEIHGIQNGLGWIGPIEHWVDWTDGCIALTDSQMDEVWNLVPVGTAVDIQR